MQTLTPTPAASPAAEFPSVLSRAITRGIEDTLDLALRETAATQLAGRYHLKNPSLADHLVAAACWHARRAGNQWESLHLNRELWLVEDQLRHEQWQRDRAARVARRLAELNAQRAALGLPALAS